MTLSATKDPATILEHAGWLRSLARQLVVDPNTADDVVQTTLMAAMAWEGTPREGMRNWLAGVARNVARQIRRGETRRSVRENRAAIPESTPSSEEMVELVDTQRWLAAAVLELEEPYRSTIYLRYFEELGAQQIASRLDVPDSTVRVRIKRGLAQLRLRLEQNNQESDKHWSLALVPLLKPSAGEALAPLAGRQGLPHWLQNLLAAASLKSSALLFMALTAALVILFSIDRQPGGDNDARALSLTDSQSPRGTPVAQRATPIGERTTQPTPARREPPEILAIPMEGFLTGRVLDAIGEPISSARVIAVQAHTRAPQTLRFDSQPEFQREVQTDLHGIYLIPIEPNHPHVVRVLHPDWAPQQSRVLFAGELEDIQLHPGWGLQVAVVDLQQSLAIADVKVRVESIDPYRVPTSWSFEATTDPAGIAYFSHIPQGKYRYRIEGQGYAQAKGVRNIEGSGPTELVVSLSKSITVTGEVVDAKSQQPIAGALVTGPTSSTTTDHRGKFILDGFAPNAKRVPSVTALAEDYPPAAQYVNIGQAGPRPHIKLELRQWVRLHGRVVDSAGRPMANQPVFFRGRYSPNPDRVERHDGQVTTDPSGHFEIAMHYRAQYTLGAKAAGFAPASARIRNFNPSIARLEIGDLVLHRAGSISGQVRGRTYDRVRPDNIQLDLLTHGDFRTAPPLMVELAPVTATGHFLLEDLAPGLYGLTLLGAKPNGAKGTVALVRKTIRVEPGKSLTGIGLTPVTPITGQVDLSNGQPAGRVSVTARRTLEGPAIAFVTTGPTGQFELVPEGDGPFVITASDMGLVYGKASLADVPPGASGLRFTLEARRTRFSIKGRILDNHGNPVLGIRLRLVVDKDGGNLACQAEMDEHGYFEFKNLNDEPYSIHATDPLANFKFTSLYAISPNADPVEFRLERRE